MIFTRRAFEFCIVSCLLFATASFAAEVADKAYEPVVGPVSYTHLTLPTILRV